METEQNNEVVQRTPAQEALVSKILQSRRIKDKEYQKLRKIWINQVLTLRDASVFIEYVLSTLTFRRRFQGKKSLSFKRCFFCNSRDDVERYHNLKTDSKYWICESCALNLNGDSTIRVKFEEQNEAAADILRKYPQDSSVLIEQENGKQ